MPDSSPAAPAPPTDPAPLLAPLGAALGAEWRCLANAVIRAWGEGGRVDIVALHPRRGVALVGLIEEGEEASPEGAVAAFRAMLAEMGFAARFSGELGVVALTAAPGERDGLAKAIGAAFDRAAPSTAAAGWLDWIVRQLEAAPSGTGDTKPAEREEAGAAQPAAEVPRLRLVAPPRDDIPARAPAATAILEVARDSRLSAPATPGDNLKGWAQRLGFALAITILLLAAFTVFSPRL